MKFVLLVLLSFVSTASAGCPPWGIQNGDVEILECQFDKDNKPTGAAMLVNLNYSNERGMGTKSAKNSKSKIFFYSDDKDVCKKFVKGKMFCMSLSQWCIMSGNPPGGATFTVNTISDGKCQVDPNKRVPSPVLETK